MPHLSKIWHGITSISPYWVCHSDYGSSLLGYMPLRIHFVYADYRTFSYILILVLCKPFNKFQGFNINQCQVNQCLVQTYIGYLQANVTHKCTHVECFYICTSTQPPMTKISVIDKNLMAIAVLDRGAGRSLMYIQEFVDGE